MNPGDGQWELPSGLREAFGSNEGVLKVYAVEFLTLQLVLNLALLFKPTALETM